jgi:hypothetical protein
MASDGATSIKNFVVGVGGDNKKRITYCLYPPDSQQQQGGGEIMYAR